MSNGTGREKSPRERLDARKYGVDPKTGYPYGKSEADYPGARWDDKKYKDHLADWLSKNPGKTEEDMLDDTRSYFSNEFKVNRLGYEFRTNDNGEIIGLKIDNTSGSGSVDHYFNREEFAKLSTIKRRQLTVAAKNHTVNLAILQDLKNKGEEDSKEYQFMKMIIPKEIAKAEVRVGNAKIFEPDVIEGSNFGGVQRSGDEASVEKYRIRYGDANPEFKKHLEETGIIKKETYKDALKKWPGPMKDQFGLFQGGEKGRTFGRWKDKKEAKAVAAEKAAADPDLWTALKSSAKEGFPGLKIGEHKGFDFLEGGTLKEYIANKKAAKAEKKDEVPADDDERKIKLHKKAMQLIPRMIPDVIHNQQARIAESEKEQYDEIDKQAAESNRVQKFFKGIKQSVKDWDTNQSVKAGEKRLLAYKKKMGRKLKRQESLDQDKTDQINLDVQAGEERLANWKKTQEAMLAAKDTTAEEPPYVSSPRAPLPKDTTIDPEPDDTLVEEESDFSKWWTAAKTRYTDWNNQIMQDKAKKEAEKAVKAGQARLPQTLQLAANKVKQKEKTAYDRLPKSMQRRIDRRVNAAEMVYGQEPDRRRREELKKQSNDAAAYKDELIDELQKLEKSLASMGNLKSLPEDAPQEWVDYYLKTNKAGTTRANDLWDRAEAIRQELGLTSITGQPWPAGTPPAGGTQPPPAQTNAGAQKAQARVDYYRSKNWAPDDTIDMGLWNKQAGAQPPPGQQVTNQQLHGPPQPAPNDVTQTNQPSTPTIQAGTQPPPKEKKDNTPPTWSTHYVPPNEEAVTDELGFDQAAWDELATALLEGNTDNYDAVYNSEVNADPNSISSTGVPMPKWGAKKRQAWYYEYKRKNKVSVEQRHALRDWARDKTGKIPVPAFIDQNKVQWRDAAGRQSF